MTSKALFRCKCGNEFIGYISRHRKFCSNPCQRRYRIRVTGYKSLKGSLSKLGSKNPMWEKVKDGSGYSALHTYIRRRLVKPKNCQHCGKEKKLDLANKSQKYKRDLSDWLWLCKSCHCAYDDNYPPVGVRKGQKWTEEQRKKLSAIKKGKHYSPKTEFKKGLIPWNKGLKK